MNDAERQYMKTIVAKELVRAKRLAEREVAKVEIQLTDTLDMVEQYMKKHPRQAAAITLSLGAAMGAAGALLFRQKNK